MLARASLCWGFVIYISQYSSYLYRKMSSSVQLFRDQKYHELKRQCIQQRRLFEDPEFPASDESLFYQKAPRGKVEWKRPKVMSAHSPVMRCYSYYSTPTIFSMLKQLLVYLSSLFPFISCQCAIQTEVYLSFCCPKWKSCLTLWRWKGSIQYSLMMLFYCWWLSNNKQCEVTPAVGLFRSSHTQMCSWCREVKVCSQRCVCAFFLYWIEHLLPLLCFSDSSETLAASLV